MSPRSFVFSVWVANNKDALKTVAALETIAANNFTVAKEGGRVLVSASMGGKSYSYSLPPDQTAGTLAHDRGGHYRETENRQRTPCCGLTKKQRKYNAHYHYKDRGLHRR
jgi:hypothetical protein